MYTLTVNLPCVIRKINKQPADIRNLEKKNENEIIQANFFNEKYVNNFQILDVFI